MAPGRALDVVARQRAGLLDGPSEPLGGRLDLAAGAGDGLARLPDDYLGEFLGAVLDALGDGREPVRALHHRGLPEFGFGPLCGRQRVVGVGRRRRRDAGELAALRQVGHLDALVGRPPDAPDV